MSKGLYGGVGFFDDKSLHSSCAFCHRPCAHPDRRAEFQNGSHDIRRISLASVYPAGFINISAHLRSVLDLAADFRMAPQEKIASELNCNYNWKNLNKNLKEYLSNKNVQLASLY